MQHCFISVPEKLISEMNVFIRKLCFQVDFLFCGACFLKSCAIVIHFYFLKETLVC